ncbi:hypothetical protein A33Q_0246 [Indibacter alkaliphilus LW1]|uniref:Uncharacterized protein n=1 Tax=Indibacter alkaliphilus (strain CCUG 57479 / KCTC 22604 / LW1) TaxID=1189612 RepID=S2DMA0_INDAL|nr:hypothetical protein A33Q_0246 [Indibacter alkaliphilus LW1]
MNLVAKLIIKAEYQRMFGNLIPVFKLFLFCDLQSYRFSI